MKVHYVPSAYKRTMMGVSLLLLIASGETAWWAWQASTPAILQPQTPPHTAHTVALQPQFSPARSPAAAILTTTEGLLPTHTLQVKALQPESYWLQADGQEISLVPQPVALNTAASSEQALRAGVMNLLTNAKTDDRSSAIPAGTRLLGLRTAPEGIYINLSHEFSQGGGSRSMIYRVAQILYTVTSLDSNAKVYLSIEGQPLDETHPLGGEGLMLKQPLTRQQFGKDFPLS